MQLGDSYSFRPSAFSEEKSGALAGRKEKTRMLTGRVVYIHPARRYFTVEVLVHGQAIRENFQFKKRS